MLSHRSWNHRISIATTLATSAMITAFSALASAHPVPDLDFDPAPSVDQLRADLAETLRGAMLWLMEGEEDALSVWVWRVPGDPDLVGLFADAAWADAPELTVRDLGEAMDATVEVFGAYFEQADPGWSDRAHALAQRLAGVEQRLETYTVMDEDGAAFYSVQVSDRFIDLHTLEALEGTWVQVTLVRD